VLNIAGSTPGAGALAGGAVAGAGTAQDGTAAARVVLCCAPDAWIDGGLAPGTQNANSRCLNLRGLKYWHVWGCNFRNAQFLVKLDQCPGDINDRVQFCYNTMRDAGHAACQFAGHWQAHSGKWGHTQGVTARYNRVDGAGLGDRAFGEGFYVGQGSAVSYTAIECHHIDIEANELTGLSAEAFEAKIGGHDIRFVDNYIHDCTYDGGNTANAAWGVPGGIHIWPPYGTYDAPAGTNPNIYVGRNRLARCTSITQKFPSAMILIGHRGVTVVGNLFEDCDQPDTPMIAIYTIGSHSFGDTGTIEVHNNTSLQAGRDVLVTEIGGTSNPGELANAQANTNASNNVGPAALAGVDVVATSADFGDDGTGWDGATAVPAPGGALDVAGADTSAHMATDFASRAMVAPINPGARQL